VISRSSILVLAMLGCVTPPDEHSQFGSEPQMVSSAETLCRSERDVRALSLYYRAEIDETYPHVAELEACTVNPLVESQEITRSCDDLHRELQLGREAQLAQRRIAARSIRRVMLLSLRACLADDIDEEH
jgi:hypothetical protein